MANVGFLGAGTAYKLIVNLLGSIQIAATAESLLQAERAGLDLDKVAMALGTGGAGSPQVANNSKRMAAGKQDQDVVFSAKWRLKDTKYGVGFAASLGQASRLGREAQQMFQQLVDAGFANSSEGKLIDILRNDPANQENPH